jgi:predicted RND superfamily exporter protein
VLWGMSLLVIGLMAFVPQNELNDEFVKYFDERVDFRVDTDFTTENLTGIYNIAYSLEAGETGAISEPAFLNKLDAFASWYRQQPEVLHVNSLSDTMKRLNRNLHGDDPEWYRLPDQRELAAQYLLLYEMSLPYGLDLNNQINIDKSATKLDVTLNSLSSNDTITLEERAQQWLRDNAPASMQVHGASPVIMFSHIGARNIRSMLTGTTLALVLISFILVFALRSLRIGLISIIPNLVPAGMAFGLWGLLVGEIGLALSVVTGMTLGIVVDDTVHFLSKYLRARREEGLSAADAVRYAFHTVGKALWTTSAVLIAGFLVLTRSPFELNSAMGLVSALTIGLALLADFLLLPTLLMTLDKRDRYEKSMAADPVKPSV